MAYPELWADQKNHTILHFPGDKYNSYRLTTLDDNYCDGWVDEAEAKKLIKKYGMEKMTVMEAAK